MSFVSRREGCRVSSRTADGNHFLLLLGAGQEVLRNAITWLMGYCCSVVVSGVRPSDGVVNV